MNDRLDDSVHDYLDGRLEPGDRSAFERRLRSDPELAARLAEAHELRGEIRRATETLPEPSPGFYAESRARFETTGSAPRFRRLRLSWEAAGLVAASVVVAGLFLPWMLQELPGRPRSDARSMGEPRPAPAAERVPAGEISAEPAPPSASASDRATDASGFSPVPESPPAAAPDQKAPSAKRAGSASASGGRDARRPSRILDETASRGLAEALPRGVVPAGDVRVVDAMQPGYARPSREGRLVLIGARPSGFACEDIVVERNDGGHRIVLGPASGDGVSARYGCAVLLPAGGGRVEVVEP